MMKAVGMSYEEIIDTLNNEQKNALELLKSQKNIFVTGNAGTGKSYLIKAFTLFCKKEKEPRKRSAALLSISYNCLISASGISGSSGGSGDTMSRISNQKVEPSPNLLLTP